MTLRAATLPNVTLGWAALTPWDVLIVGAGPAGAFSALLLAQRGARVLLVERKAFPRDKVCGGCISHQALALLRDAGLADRLDQLPAFATRQLRLYAGGRSAAISLPAGLAVRRRDLDAMLVQAAIEAGATFLPQTTARIAPLVGDRRSVDCRTSEGETAVCSASVVLVADGLAQEGLPADVAASKVVASGSRIGVGALLDGEAAALPEDLEPGTIYMTVSRQGYVGLVRTEPDRALVAAAVEPALLSGGRSPASAVASILDAAGRGEWSQLAASCWSAAAWQGTPTLTRRLRRPAAERMFVLGDAAGYVEPFTGEGIGWGIAAAQNVTPLALAAVRQWNSVIEAEWMRVEQTLMERRRRFCRLVARGLRSPWMMGAAMRVLGVAPGWSAPMVRLWDRPLPLYGSMTR